MNIFIGLFCLCLIYGLTTQQELDVNETTVTASRTTATTSTKSTTTKSSTTGPITTIPPSKYPSFYVGTSTNVCLLLQLEAKFTIEYTDKSDKSQTATVSLDAGNVPRSGFIKCTGTCDPAADSIIVQWTPTKNSSAWNLTLNVQKENVKNENGYFYIANMTVNANLDDASVFKNPKESKLTLKRYGSEPFKTTMGSYYVCQNEHKVQFNNSKSSVLLSHFKLDAFRNSTAVAFGGNEHYCPEDLLTNNIVPIAVGAALAAMVLIVLITYLIGRRRRTTGYQSI